MNASRFLYRSRQFWQALSSGPSQGDVELVSSVLTDPQIELFQCMQASEQIHSIQVFHELRYQGEKNPDLLAAALLHDVGKTRSPLRIWERAIIVIVGAVCESCVHKWGTNKNVHPGSGPGWRRAFIVAEQHPAWGADLAAECGTSPVAVSLIARHQERVNPDASTEEDILLQKLQAVDDNH
ncbi:MAG: HD domain-containing protein [Anaerolineales bacterium]|nr:HD domain-containing protein [Anaerolineales bacterium]